MFGQFGYAVPGNTTTTTTNGTKASNVLLDLVDWVENGNAPDTIVGESADGSTTRTHCRYPMKSVWNGSKWTCQ